ncbi:MAG TPA: HpsJ family protein [Coleofasciculaceae cyanobacterium]|jgi:hypothetical protein
MKSSPIYSSFTALTLKIVGLIMMLSSLLDCILVAIPFNLLQRNWQIGFTTQLVDRGLLPLVGIALFSIGYWIDYNSGTAPTDQKPSVQDLRFWVFLLASLLGLIFLLLVPLHINNIVQQSNETFQQINQKATQAETQIQNETQQVNALLKDEQKLSELEKAIESGQIPGNQLPQAQLLREQLQTFKKDPNALNKQVEAAKNKIRTEKQNAENETKTGALKLGLRTGLSSLLLAIGYIVIGWTGFRSLGSSSVSRR